MLNNNGVMGRTHTMYAYPMGGSLLSFDHPLIPWGQEHLSTYVACVYCGKHSDSKRDDCKSCGAPLPRLADDVFAPLPRFKQEIPAIEEDHRLDQVRRYQQPLWNKIVDYIRGSL